MLEVLIALSVLAISMLGIYSLINQSVTMTEYGKDKLYVVDKGYERVLKQVHYPRISMGETEEAEGHTITYSYTKRSTIFPGITNVILRVKSESAAVSYEYFERSR